MKPEIELTEHDKYQVEIKIACPIMETKAVSDYYADIFFFLPRNLAINAQTYTAREFYNDFSEYIRFQTPMFDLGRLALPDNTVLMRLSESMSRLPDGLENYQRCLKMFCSIARSAMQHGASGVERVPAEERKKAVARYLRNIRKLLGLFRSLRSRIPADSNGLELFDLVDEFLSVTANLCLYRLWNGFSELKWQCEKPLAALAGNAYREIKYRRMRKYPSVPDADADNSELLYRESTLKKAMASILFLNVATKKDGIMVENLLLGLSAAVAMAFATSVSFLWKGLFLEEFSLSFFIVWVISYMFKDRIKSQLQLFCLNNRARYSYDYRQKIHDGFGNEIGVCREGFRCHNGRDIDGKISAIRKSTMLSRLDNGALDENVIVYRKQIELFGDSCKDIFREFSVNGVLDICRFNIRHWLNKMDNPNRIIFTSDGRRVTPIKAHRDYHVNIVLRYGEKGGEAQYARYRLVLCRNGIRGLEKIS